MLSAATLGAGAGSALATASATLTSAATVGFCGFDRWRCSLNFNRRRSSFVASGFGGNLGCCRQFHLLFQRRRRLFQRHCNRFGNPSRTGGRGFGGNCRNQQRREPDSIPFAPDAGTLSPPWPFEGAKEAIAAMTSSSPWDDCSAAGELVAQILLEAPKLLPRLARAIRVRQPAPAQAQLRCLRLLRQRLPALQALPRRRLPRERLVPVPARTPT